MKNLWMAAVVGIGLTVNVVRGNPVTIVNGDFSDPIVGGSFSTLSGPNLGGDTSFLPGWTVYGSIDHIGTYWNGPTPGAQSLDMNGYYDAGTISQTIHLSSGSLATVVFYLAGNPDAGPVTKTLGVSLTGEVSGSQVFTFDVVGTDTKDNMGWVKESATFNVVAPGDYTLSFASLDDPEGAFGPALADVSMFTTVPDGGMTVALLGGALAGLGAMRRKLFV